MSKHTLDDLRNMMFETLQALKDKKNPMEIERAMAMKEVAQVIINSAKVEVDHMRVSGGTGSGFIPVQPNEREQRSLLGDTMTVATRGGEKTVTQLPNGITVTRHKIGG
jgi:adenosyl cobinamide kinase/adenosyl cobinamide phosphate guanylyltransferase